MVNRSCKEYMQCDHVFRTGSCNGCGNAGGATEIVDSLKQKYFYDALGLDKLVHERVVAHVTHTGIPSIKNVIFNNPATIIQWEDGTKTVVKCQPNDIYDPEKGMAMAIAKKALGNKGKYLETFKEWLPKEEVSNATIANVFAEFINSICSK